LQITDTLNIEDEILRPNLLEVENESIVKKSLNGLEDESNGFVIVSEQQHNLSSSHEKLIDNTEEKSNKFPVISSVSTPAFKKTNNIKPSKLVNREEKLDFAPTQSENILSHNRSKKVFQFSKFNLFVFVKPLILLLLQLK